MYKWWIMYMIAPDQVSTAHTLAISKHTLYSMEDVAVTVLTKAKITGTDGIRFDVKEIVGNAGPLFHIAPLVTKAMYMYF